MAPPPPPLSHHPSFPPVRLLAGPARPAPFPAGLFGLDAQAPSKPGMNSAGILVAMAALVVFLFVKPENDQGPKAKDEDAAEESSGFEFQPLMADREAGHEDEATGGCPAFCCLVCLSACVCVLAFGVHACLCACAHARMCVCMWKCVRCVGWRAWWYRFPFLFLRALVCMCAHATPCLALHAVNAAVPRGGSNKGFFDSLPPLQRRICGVVLALVSGCLYGSNFDPPQYIADHHTVRACLRKRRKAPFYAVLQPRVLPPSPASTHSC